MFPMTPLGYRQLHFQPSATALPVRIWVNVRPRRRCAAERAQTFGSPLDEQLILLFNYRMRLAFALATIGLWLTTLAPLRAASGFVQAADGRLFEGDLQLTNEFLVV